VSSHLLTLYRHDVLVPSTDSSVIGTLFVCPAFWKYVFRSARSVPAYSSRPRLCHAPVNDPLP
jgi:hypothetical protein